MASYEFTNKNVDLDVLKKRAYNLRWAEMGEDVIPLTAADMDFIPAQPIRDALIEYIQGGYFSYSPKLGTKEFRESMSRALWERKKEKVSPEHILPVDSAARGMHVIAKAMLHPGDEMIVFDPVDFLFRTAAEKAGATVKLFPTKVKDGKIDVNDLESYITPNTKMLGLCNPHNPFGLLYTEETLQHILDLSEKYGFWIMNDEVWSDIIYEGSEFKSIMSLENTDRVLSVFGFSKSFGLAGLRAGVVYSNNEEAFQRLVDASGVLTTEGGMSILSEVAATAALDNCYPWVDEYRHFLTENRDYAVDRLNKMPGLKAYTPEGTFVLYVDITGTGMSGVEFTDYIRENYKVALVPGGKQFFGPGSEGHIRICIATSREILKEAFDRLEAGLNALLK